MRPGYEMVGGKRDLTFTKYREFFPTLFVKITDFQLVFNFEQTRTVTIFGEHGMMAHIP